MVGFICTQGTNRWWSVLEHVNKCSGCVNGGKLLGDLTMRITRISHGDTW